MSRQIILNLAISLDGYISDEDGGFDWIKGHNDNSQDTKKKFNFKEFIDSVDTIIMGRKAFEDCGIEGYEDKNIIVATSKKRQDYDNVKFINNGICKYVLELKKKKGQNIWLFGGGGLTDNFIKDKIVDRYIIGIIPTILGNGRKLFLNDNPKIDLNLDEYTVNDGIIILEYSIRS